MRIDIHNYEYKYQSELDRLNKSDVRKRNKSIILKFVEDCALDGIGKPRRIKLLEVLRRVSLFLNKDFDKITKEDIRKYIQYLEESHYSDWSKHTFKSILKRFYKWYNGDNEKYPPLVSWIKTNFKDCKKIPEELLTREEVLKMVGCSFSIKEKALVISLFESGCRIGEIGNLKLKNVKFDTYGCFIIVSGKTGMRRVRLIESTPYLANWIENHPYKDEPESPIWLSSQYEKKYMAYTTINSLLRKLAKKAGIKKRVNPHNYRHSRSSINANFLTESQMNSYFGWIQGSKMPSVYVHLSGRDIDDAILKLNGLKPKENVKEEKKVRNCFRCKTDNPSTSKYCYRCGALLDLKIEFEKEVDNENFEEFMEFYRKWKEKQK